MCGNVIDTVISNNGMNKIFCVLGCCEWCVGLHKSRLFGERLLVKPESLYASYNAMLIQRTNFLDMMYVCMVSEWAMCMYIVCAILRYVYWYHMYVYMHVVCHIHGVCMRPCFTACVCVCVRVCVCGGGACVCAVSYTHLTLPTRSTV